MVFQNKKLNRLLVGALVVALAVPIVNIFLIYPNFSVFLTRNIEDSAIRLAQHMEYELQKTGGWLSILKGEEPGPVEIRLLDSYMSDFALRKMKIFSAKGVAVYSTDKTDIGRLNNRAYFHEKVAKGQVFSELVKKDAKSLEGQTYQVDVVEVYVPSMQGEKFRGAFELYYNITQQVTSLDRLIWYASILPFAVSGFLLFALYWGFRNLDKSLIEQKRAEEEIKALQGILPICMFCKEIRDDKGYWNQIEAYIESHSEAQFTHGICDPCLEKHYGKKIADQVSASLKDESQT